MALASGAQAANCDLSALVDFCATSNDPVADCAPGVLTALTVAHDECIKKLANGYPVIGWIECPDLNDWLAGVTIQFPDGHLPRACRPASAACPIGSECAKNAHIERQEQLKRRWRALSESERQRFYTFEKFVEQQADAERAKKQHEGRGR